MSNPLTADARSFLSILFSSIYKSNSHFLGIYGALDFLINQLSLQTYTYVPGIIHVHYIDLFKHRFVQQKEQNSLLLNYVSCKTFIQFRIGSVLRCR